MQTFLNLHHAFFPHMFVGRNAWQSTKNACVEGFALSDCVAGLKTSKFRGNFHSTKIRLWKFGHFTSLIEQYIPVAQTRPKPPARLVIVIVSRTQRSGTADNNFVKWKGTFRYDRQKWPGLSQWRPPSKVVPNIAVVPNRNGLFHSLISNLNFRNSELNGKLPWFNLLLFETVFVPGVLWGKRPWQRVCWVLCLKFVFLHL